MYPAFLFALAVFMAFLSSTAALGKSMRQKSASGIKSILPDAIKDAWPVRVCWQRLSSRTFVICLLSSILFLIFFFEIRMHWFLSSSKHCSSRFGCPRT